MLSRDVTGIGRERQCSLWKSFLRSFRSREAFWGFPYKDWDDFLGQVSVNERVMESNCH